MSGSAIQPMVQQGSVKIGVVACGALARELQSAMDGLGMFDVAVKYLPAKLHNSPKDIPQAVEHALKQLQSEERQLFVAYGDCGTAGALDKVLEQFDASRLPGAHCYSFFAGEEVFTQEHNNNPGTFYLTDYLARQFETLVYKPLGLDRHPELLSAYFGNYTQLIFLTQTDDAKLEAKAIDAAMRLNLRYKKIVTGLMPFTDSIKREVERI